MAGSKSFSNRTLNGNWYEDRLTASLFQPNAPKTVTEGNAARSARWLDTAARVVPTENKQVEYKSLSSVSYAKPAPVEKDPGNIDADHHIISVRQKHGQELPEITQEPVERYLTTTNHTSYGGDYSASPGGKSQAAQFSKPIDRSIAAGISVSSFEQKPPVVKKLARVDPSQQVWLNNAHFLNLEAPAPQDNSKATFIVGSQDLQERIMQQRSEQRTRQQSGSSTVPNNGMPKSGVCIWSG